MEIHLSPEQESRLAAIALYEGQDTEHLIQGIIEKILAEDERFRAAVAQGIDSLDRGEFVAHEEIETMIDRLLQS